jgi:hypothetical protein
MLTSVDVAVRNEIASRRQTDAITEKRPARCPSGIASGFPSQGFLFLCSLSVSC